MSTDVELNDELLTLARSYKLRLTVRQEQLVNRILGGCADLYNHALIELGTLLRDNQHLPKGGDFKKNYAKHRHRDSRLCLAPSQVSQSVYDKLLASVKLIRDRNRLEFARDFYKKHIDFNLTEGEKTALKKQLSPELSKHINRETLRMFKSKSLSEYTCIPYFLGQYETHSDADGRLLSVTILHGATLFKNDPDKQLGTLRVFNKQKPLLGTPKRIEINRKADGYYLTVSVEMPRSLLPQTNKPTPGSSTGIDFGSKTIITLSDGSKMKRYSAPAAAKYKRLWVRLNNLQKVQSRIEDTYRKMNNLPDGAPNSRNYREVVKKVQSTQLEIKRMREFHNHAITNDILANYETICVEDVSVSDILVKERDGDQGKRQHSGMNRNISNNSWGELKAQLGYKGKWRQRNIVLVPAAHSTQTCSACGYVRTKPEQLKLKDRLHKCIKCGTEMDRDVNAAKNIHQKGLEIQSQKIQSVV